MEIDLRRHYVDTDTYGIGGKPFRAKVCVVGAGIAGITLAYKLSQQGVEVALLEAGGHTVDPFGAKMFSSVQFAGREHVGTREGRFRVYGGSSLGWGGQLFRMPDSAEGWAIGAEELAPFQAEAERLLGVDALPYPAQEFFAAAGMERPGLLEQMGEVDASLSKWTPFARRNMAQTVGRGLLRLPHVSVYLHAQVTEVLLTADGTRVEAVLVWRNNREPFRFEAEQFVVAAGTVETSRLLLASRSVAKQGVGNAHAQVGLRFHDHPTLPVATFAGPARARMLEELRPWVMGETVHSVKIEASAGLRERLGLNPVLAHVTIEEPEGSGIAVVRELLTSIQRGRFGGALRRHAWAVPGALAEAVRLAWAAKVRRRRFVSKDAVVRLQLNVVQDAPSMSNVGLTDEVYAFGMQQALVDWRVSGGEVKTLRRYAAYLKDRFEAAGMTGVDWVPELFDENAPLPGMDDARHAMGGASMGNDPANSVVDAQLRVHGVENLWVASAAVFPTGSPQLPTLPLMALTLRLAEQLGRLG
jgi:choline dehydrogenase-like flavoprotein